MKLPNAVLKLSLAAAVAISATALAPRMAQADATCTGLITSKFNNLRQFGSTYDFEMTVTKDPLAYVTYSSGELQLSGSYLYGAAPLQFSDRWDGNQNFAVNGNEHTEVWINQTGTLWIYSDNYHYWIVSNVDMSCTGGLISKYVQGLGLVTVAIRGYNRVL
jgi:hypothetical protein